MQERRNSSALAVELRLSCINSSMCITFRYAVMARTLRYEVVVFPSWLLLARHTPLEDIWASIHYVENVQSEDLTNPKKHNPAGHITHGVVVNVCEISQRFKYSNPNCTKFPSCQKRVQAWPSLAKANTYTVIIYYITCAHVIYALRCCG